MLREIPDNLWVENRIRVGENNDFAFSLGNEFVQEGTLADPFFSQYGADSRIFNGCDDLVGPIRGTVGSDQDFNTIRRVIEVQGGPETPLDGVFFVVSAQDKGDLREVRIVLTRSGMPEKGE
jgi:hypothetical protein